ncbi:hypothetical protein LZC95_35300 [Pendulispora brunnea]|uniref:Uncharacterized protein n=1 Tax=Pendulispora brunnea TaxID=2905690 RepID=A0ABZ2JZ11_9BACT
MIVRRGELGGGVEDLTTKSCQLFDHLLLQALCVGARGHQKLELIEERSHHGGLDANVENTVLTGQIFGVPPGERPRGRRGEGGEFGSGPNRGHVLRQAMPGPRHRTRTEPSDFTLSVARDLRAAARSASGIPSFPEKQPVAALECIVLPWPASTRA